MNSGSEQKLSMDELLEKNRPAQIVQPTPQSPAQELTPSPEMHPTKAEWEDLLSDLCALGYHAERQTGYLKKASELLAQMDFGQSTLSHHMRILLSAGIVQARKNGKWTYYSLRPEAYEEMVDWLRQYL